MQTIDQTELRKPTIGGEKSCLIRQNVAEPLSNCSPAMETLNSKQNCSQSSGSLEHLLIGP